LTWLKLDDKRALHRKFRRQGFAARGLDEAASCWSAHEETDGFISEEGLEDLAHHHGVSVTATLKLVAQLIDPMDRWERDEARPGWLIKGFLENNPSHAELEAKRKRDRDRKRVATES
jgi:hypothetical protein